MFKLLFKTFLLSFFLFSVSWAEALQCISLIEKAEYDLSFYKTSPSKSKKIDFFKEVLSRAVETKSSLELKQLILIDHDSSHSRVPNWIRFLPDIVESKLLDRSFWDKLEFSPLFQNILLSENESVREDAGAVLDVFAKLSKKDLPKNLVSIVEDELGLINREGAVVMSNYNQSRVRVIQDKTQFAGTCGQMCLGHGLSFAQIAVSVFELGIFEGVKKSFNRIESLRKLKDMENLSIGQSVLIKMEGVGLIGSVKYIGENSMLALKTILDEEGRVLMSAGNVYRVSRKFFEISVEPIIVENKKYAILNIPKEEAFELKPLAFGVESLTSRENGYEKTSKETRQGFVKILVKAAENIELNYTEFLEAIYKTQDN
jgi:hypothetical protein